MREKNRPDLTGGARQGRWAMVASGGRVREGRRWEARPAEKSEREGGWEAGCEESEKGKGKRER